MFMVRKTLITASVCACLALTLNQTSAQEAKDKKPAAEGGGAGHHHSTKIPATVEEIWKAIHKQQQRLASTVEKKELGEAHDHAFAIRDLVKALPGKVAPEDKTKAEESAKEIAKLAADIDKSGAAGAQKATEANVKKMDAAISALQAKLKPNQAKN
jgi:hypothetical protein